MFPMLNNENGGEMGDISHQRDRHGTTNTGGNGAFKEF